MDASSETVLVERLKDGDGAALDRVGVPCPDDYVDVCFSSVFDDGRADAPSAADHEESLSTEFVHARDGMLLLPGYFKGTGDTRGAEGGRRRWATT